MSTVISIVRNHSFCSPKIRKNYYKKFFICCVIKYYHYDRLEK